MTTRLLEELAYPYEGDTTADFDARQFAPNDTHWSQHMISCPCCNSGTLNNNRIENDRFLDVAASFIEKQRAGKPAHAIGEAVVWGAKALFNRSRAEWKCGICGAVF
jgi:hypothetical protein